jgi:hypothetical protein
MKMTMMIEAGGPEDVADQEAGVSLCLEIL